MPAASAASAAISSATERCCRLRFAASGNCSRQRRKAVSLPASRGVVDAARPRCRDREPRCANSAPISRAAARAARALGILAFRADINNLALGEPAPAPAGCPVPETVPGGLYFDPTRGPAVGDIEGRRDVTLLSPGIAGLVVPQSLLVGGTS